IACVYSQPPRPAGRGLAERPSPVHALAASKGIEIRTPASLKSPEERQRFAALKADAAVVVAYGLLLPKPVLAAPRLGCFNVHASLLPRWRGAAPIQRAIMAGDAETGVSIMRMDEGLDTGAVCAVARVPIHPALTAGELRDELVVMGARLMVETLGRPRIDCLPQTAEGITYANKIDKAETKIDFARPAAEVRNHINGLSPFPGAWFMFDGHRIKALKAMTVTAAGSPGTVLDEHFTIACGTGAVRVLRAQREGKAPLPATEFLRGFALAPGTVIG
ncbi:MAG: methionyl-tRNA formyltransferase, partial [Rhizobiales bacterium]|nr:methionyl-tRNA formyltransferase [Hyphomicrobiales bacterium]